MYDCDGHIFEKESEIYEFLGPPFNQYPRLKNARLFPSGDVWNKTILDILDDIEAPKVRDVGAQEWLDFLDMAELEGTVLYPSAATRIGFVRETEFAIELAKAYNSWMHEKFLTASPRLKAIALLPLQDVDEAVNELRRAVKELGMVGALLPGVGLRRMFGDRYYDPIYATAQELNIPLVIHGGATNMPGLVEFDRALKNRTLSHPFCQLMQTTDMMFSGVFDRYPGLRMGFMEAGIGWVLFLLDRMNRSIEMGWRVEAPELVKHPREHFVGGQLFFHAELDEEFLPYALELLGNDRVMYASDFPHQSPEYCMEDRRKFSERSDLSSESKTKILGDNAKRFYGFN